MVYTGIQYAGLHHRHIMSIISMASYTQLRSRMQVYIYWVVNDQT